MSSPAAAADRSRTDQRRTRFGLRTGVGLLVVVAGAAVFLTLWLLVRRSWTPLASLDAGTADRLNRVVDRHPLLVRVLSVVTDLGGSGTAVLVLGLTAAFLAIRGRRRLALFTVVTGAGMGVLIPVTKALIDRARPVVAVPVVDTPGNASFPSGHAVTAMVIWGLLLVVVLPSVRRRSRPWLVAAAALVVLAVGVTRLALGVHFVSDVLAGWALGAAWLAVTVGAFRAWQHDRGVASREPLDALQVADHDAVAIAPAGPALPRGRATVGALAGWAAGIWSLLTVLGLLVSGVLGNSWLGRADRTAARWFVEQRTTTWTTVAEAAGSLSGTRAMIAVGLSTAVLAVALTSRRRPAVFVLVVLVGEVALYGAVSQLVGRLRPQVADLTDGLPTAASWPSGHVAAAVALYGSLAALVVRHGQGRRRRWIIAVPVLVAAAVALSRLYVAAHYPTDVLAGAAVGSAWLLACTRLLLDQRPGRSPSRGYGSE